MPNDSYDEGSISRTTQLPAAFARKVALTMIAKIPLPLS